ncbi:acyltransferase [Mycolicibacterium insubricum]|uniref:Acyltransferase n=1 Tax=Mycolicibacterium insubricum TaxID=444597 RepID=A0A1X0D0I7_9MYCO|nr:acyltransferase [Mycolicibacterium insubricum]BBZ68189.1 acyltransferase [Mycolicibacterium insubricum]
MTAGPPVRDGALTGLRALAAILVIGTHSGFITGMLSHGYLGHVFGRLEIGVPIFFALSGFLLFRPWVIRAAATRDGQRAPAPSVRRYARRRVRRIMPAYLVTVLVTFAVFAVYTPGPNPGQTWPGLLRYLTLTQIYASNFMARYLHTGMPQMWSLAVEVSFYLLLPLLAYLLLGRRRAWRPAAVLSGIAALALVEPVWLMLANATHVLPDAAGMWLPAHLSPFAGGMALAVLQVTGAHCRARWALPAACAGFLLISGSWAFGSYLGPTHWWQPVVSAAAYGLIATLIVAPLALGDRGYWHRLLNLRPVVWVGEISYEIFLLHVMVMTLTIGLLLRWPPFTGPVAVLWALTLALTIPPAWLLHRCTAPRSLREADQASLRNAGSSKASARPRCDAASLASGLSSAAEQVPPSGRNTGS